MDGKMDEWKFGRQRGSSRRVGFIVILVGTYRRTCIGIRWAAALDCLDYSYVSERTLAREPTPSRCAPMSGRRRIVTTKCRGV